MHHVSGMSYKAIYVICIIPNFSSSKNILLYLEYSIYENYNCFYFVRDKSKPI